MMIRSLSMKLQSNRSVILKSLIVLLFIFYCYLATLPKHGDFWSLNYAAKIFASGKFSIYTEYAAAIGQSDVIAAMHPPAFYILQAIWLKIGSIIFNYDLNTWVQPIDPIGQPSFYPLWGMITYLFALCALVLLSYSTLKNKWLCLLCYGSFTFISMIIMGQTDIFCALLIYISLILALKSFESDKYMRLLFLSVIALGLSMTFKTYGGLLFPIYVLFSILIFKIKNKTGVYKDLTLLILTFMFTSFFIWIPYAKWLPTLMFSGESSWLLNLQISPVLLPPLHNISIWLLGYVIITYDLLNNIAKDPLRVYTDKKYFIFYNFASISWFFATVLTHPQWWVLIVPPMLLVLDNFRCKFNYLFAFSVFALFWFYPMMWVDNIDHVLRYYIPVIHIVGR